MPGSGIPSATDLQFTTQTTNTAIANSRVQLNATLGSLAGNPTPIQGADEPVHYQEKLSSMPKEYPGPHLKAIKSQWKEGRMLKWNGMYI